MHLLLDTHTFLWMALDDPRLSRTAKELLQDADNIRWLSVASIWEMAIKVNIGKLGLTEPFRTFLPEHLARNEIKVLPIEQEHVVVVSDMPFARSASGNVHADPFDRLIVAQSKVTTYPVVGIDTIFDQYGITRVW